MGEEGEELSEVALVGLERLRSQPAHRAQIAQPGGELGFDGAVDEERS